MLPSITFGVVSAFMGQLVAFPLETVSRRMQVCPAPPSMVTQWLPPFPLVILFFDVFFVDLSKIEAVLCEGSEIVKFCSLLWSYSAPGNPSRFLWSLGAARHGSFYGSLGHKTPGKDSVRVENVSLCWGCCTAAGRIRAVHGCIMQVAGSSAAALGFLPTLRDIVRRNGPLALYKYVPTCHACHLYCCVALNNISVQCPS